MSNPINYRVAAYFRSRMRDVTVCVHIIAEVLLNRLLPFVHLRLIGITAIDVTLAPGAYTAIVPGKDGTTGVALVEVYAL